MQKKRVRKRIKSAISLLMAAMMVGTMPVTPVTAKADTTSKLNGIYRIYNFFPCGYGNKEPVLRQTVRCFGSKKQETAHTTGIQNKVIHL